MTITMMTSMAVNGISICLDSYGWFRGEWVKWSERTMKLTEFYCILQSNVIWLQRRKSFLQSYFTICTSPIIHLICPPKLCITVVNFFLGIMAIPREIKEKAYAFFFLGGGGDVLWEGWKWWINCVLKCSIVPAWSHHTETIRRQKPWPH